MLLLCCLCGVTNENKNYDSVSHFDRDKVLVFIFKNVQTNYSLTESCCFVTSVCFFCQYMSSRLDFCHTGTLTL